MLERDCKKLDLEKVRVEKELIHQKMGKQTEDRITLSTTFEGKIDGHPLVIKGMVYRGGPRHPTKPSGPCMFCTRMIELGTTTRLMNRGVRCQWAGQGRRGHICSYPAALKKVIESKEFDERMKCTGSRFYGRPKRSVVVPYAQAH